MHSSTVIFISPERYVLTLIVRFSGSFLAQEEINKGNTPKDKSIYYNSTTDMFRFGDHDE